MKNNPQFSSSQDDLEIYSENDSEEALQDDLEDAELIENFNFFDHVPNEILIVEICEDGVPFNIQWNGVACSQYENTGKIFTKFNSCLKYFNPDYWYDSATWFIDEGLILFNTKRFLTKKFLKEHGLNTTYDEKIWKNQEQKAKPFATKIEDVLNEILRIAKLKTGLEIIFNDKIENYYKNWGEALIPVIINDKKCVITWDNCD